MKKIILLIVLLLSILTAQAQTVKYASFYKMGVYNRTYGRYSYTNFEEIYLRIDFYTNSAGIVNNIYFHTQKPFQLTLTSLIEQENWDPQLGCNTEMYAAVDNTGRSCQLRASEFASTGNIMLMVFYSDASFVYQIDKGTGGMDALIK